MRWPLVRVHWVDSTSPRMGWTNIATWEGVGSLECVSVGYLIAEDEKTKTIAPHLAYPDDDEQCQGNGIMPHSSRECRSPSRHDGCGEREEHEVQS